MREMAKICDVSESTVSRALADKPGINPKTLEKVKRVAQKFNYRPNALVRSIQTGITKTIGVSYSPKSDEFAIGIFDGIIRELAANDYKTMIIPWEAPESDRNPITTFSEYRVDGLILFPPVQASPARYRDALRHFDDRVVLVDQKWEGLNYNFVGSDNYHGALDATNHLVNSGHQKIGVVSAKSCFTGKERFAGYRDAMITAMLPIRERWRIEYESLNDRILHDNVNKLIASGEYPSAFVCFNDFSAVTVSHAVMDCGLRVPEDIAISGFGDLSFSTMVRPSLTTVKQHPSKIGAEAVRTLLKRISTSVISKNVQTQILIKCEVVERESTSTDKNINYTQCHPERNHDEIFPEKT